MDSSIDKCVFMYSAHCSKVIYKCDRPTANI